MLVTFLSDSHGNHPTIEPCDVVVHCGDTTVGGYFYELKKFINWYSKIPAPYKIFIAGNHDFVCEDETELVKETAAENNIIYLQDSGVVIKGYKFYGTPWTRGAGVWAFHLEDGETTHWNKIHENTDVLITHGPPYGLGDLVSKPRPDEDPHVGSPELLLKTRQLQPLVHATGHVHEGYGVYTQKDIDTITINCAHVNKYHSGTNKPITVDLSIGREKLFGLQDTFSSDQIHNL